MKIRRKTHILFIALIIVMVFSRFLKNDFAWDDKYLIINNPYVKSWDYIPRVFTGQLYEGDEMQSNFYRPLQLVSFAIDYSVWKLNPFGYHLTSLLLHIVNACLVYLIVEAIMLSPGIGFFTSLLFGIAPAISGVTFYISARSDLLMGLFLFLSMLFFIKYRRREQKSLYVISILAFILALLCKEMAVMLPLLLSLIIVGGGRDRPLRPLKYLTPYLLVLAIYIGLRLTIFNFAKGTNPIIDFNFPATIPLWSRILTDFKVLLLYLKVLLFPVGLHMEWFIVPAKNIFQWDVLASIALLSLAVFAVKKAARKNSMILFWALWFILSLSPVLNIYPVSVFFGEGWLYVPSIGFFIMFCIIFKDIIKPRIGKIFSNILAAVFLIYYSVFTIAYGKVWKDSVNLFSNVLKYENKSPFSHLSYNNLGRAYYDKGDYKESIEYYKKSITLKPDYFEGYNNLGVAYVTTGRPVTAITFFKKAIRLKKTYLSAYNNLSHALYIIGLKTSAVAVAKQALKVNPNSYKSYYTIGYAYSDKGDIAKAIESFKKAISLRPENYEPHYCLGALYLKNNNYKEALDEYKKAFKLGLCDSEFYNKLGFAYVKNNKFREAEEALRQSLALNQNQCEPHNNLGNLYSMFGYFGLAIGEYRAAYKIEPGNKGICDNIIKTKKEWKQALLKGSRLDIGK